MTIEDKISITLAASSAKIGLPDGLLETIHRDATSHRPKVGILGWLGGQSYQRLAAAVAVMLLVPLLGFQAKELWVVPAEPVTPGISDKVRPRQEMPVSDMAAAVGFDVKLPTYVPEGLSLIYSSLEGDSKESDADLRIVRLVYSQEWNRGMIVQQWLADPATPYPPADPYSEVLDTKPWYKVLSTTPVEINGVQGHVLLHLLSGTNMNTVYWHHGGTNYSITAAVSDVSLDELIKVANSFH